MEKILFEYYDLKKEYSIESAWAEKIGENYRLNNILFYARGYSWGDLVKVENRNGELYVIDLVKESGHSTVRIIFYEKDIIQQTVEELENMSCSWEGSNIKTLISVDIPPEANYKIIKEFLDKGEENELWSYEEACLAHKLD